VLAEAEIKPLAKLLANKCKELLKGVPLQLSYYQLTLRDTKHAVI
jgi:hypothetical protein